MVKLTVKTAVLDENALGRRCDYFARVIEACEKDELDLIRLAETHPELKALYPAELVEQIERG